jgi:lysophospholipase L1-like esterase
MLFVLVAASCSRRGHSPDVSAPGQQRIEKTLPSSLHVVVIGDSLAYGAGDESGRGISGRLEAELERRGVSSVETRNLGVNGAQTGDVLTRLRQERIRAEVKKADAIVLSIGANDLFRTPGSREETLKNPLGVAERILERIAGIVSELRRLNADAEIMILGGYNPVPGHAYTALINEYLGLWDAALEKRFASDGRIAVVRMSDIVVPTRLSRYDSFHPGGEAYEAASRRIAVMLLDELESV